MRKEGAKLCLFADNKMQSIHTKKNIGVNKRFQQSCGIQNQHTK